MFLDFCPWKSQKPSQSRHESHFSPVIISLNYSSENISCPCEKINQKYYHQYGKLQQEYDNFACRTIFSREKICIKWPCEFSYEHEKSYLSGKERKLKVNFVNENKRKTGKKGSMPTFFHAKNKHSVVGAVIFVCGYFRLDGPCKKVVD